MQNRPDPDNVFLSYNKDENPEFIESIKNELKKLKIKLFIDIEGIKPGDEWEGKIEKVLENCKILIVCLGTEGMGDFQQEEFEIFRMILKENESKHRIIPIWLPGLKINTVTRYIRRLQAIDLRKTTYWREQLKKIREILQEIEQSDSNNEKYEIDFVNRQDIVDVIKPLKLFSGEWKFSPYISIRGPVAFGKTHLVKHLNKLAQEPDLANRMISIVLDLNGCKGKHGYKQIKYIVDNISDGKINCNNAHLLDDAEELIDFLQKKIIALPNTGILPWLLLLFDAIDELDEISRQWLYTFFEKINKSTKVGDENLYCLRIVIAGRNPDIFWGEFKNKAGYMPEKTFNLSLFDDNAIHEFIAKEARRIGLNLTNPIIRKYSKELDYLGCSHPKILAGLGKYLSDRKFILPKSPEEYFLENCKSLVLNYVTPESVKFRGQLSDDIANCLDILCAFRDIKIPILDNLIKDNMISSSINSRSLYKLIEKEMLFGARSSIYPSWRYKFIYLDLRYRENRDFKEIHKYASKLFASWVNSCGLSPEYKILEWVFHLLQANQVSLAEMKMQLMNFFNDLPSGFEYEAKERVLDGLNDPEIERLLFQRFGDPIALDECCM